MTFELAEFDYYSPYLHKAVDVYCTVWGRNLEDSTTFFRKYARMQHFVGYVALVGGHVVGIAFGTASQAGQWWHDKVSTHVGKNHHALANAWVLTELAVLQPYRKHNIGSALHDKVLEQQPFPNVLLSTQVDNVKAREFYEKRHWTYLHRGFSFQKNRPNYCIMHRAMPHAS
ncbi:MAG: GNAT family N-acetyltransferase [Chloroflexota bacterium]